MTQLTPESSVLKSLALKPAAVTIAAAVALAVLINLGIWLLGLAVGGTFQYLKDGVPHTTTAPMGVVSMTTIPMISGLVLTVIALKNWNGSVGAARRLRMRVLSAINLRPLIVRTAQVVGTVAPLAAITQTLTAGFDAASTIALTVMHVVVATLVPLSVEILSRRFAAPLPAIDR
jgi:hypothetical protein